jgi:hypothetical protein
VRADLTEEELEKINKVEFDCRGCCKTVTYQEYEKHVTEECPSLQIACPAGCGKGLLKDISSLRNHLYYGCVKVDKGSMKFFENMSSMSAELLGEEARTTLLNMQKGSLNSIKPHAVNLLFPP